MWDILSCIHNLDRSSDCLHKVLGLHETTSVHYLLGLCLLNPPTSCCCDPQENNYSKHVSPFLYNTHPLFRKWNFLTLNQIHKFLNLLFMISIIKCLPGYLCIIMEWFVIFLFWLSLGRLFFLLTWYSLCTEHITKVYSWYGEIYNIFSLVSLLLFWMQMDQKQGMSSRKTFTILFSLTFISAGNSQKYTNIKWYCWLVSQAIQRVYG